MTRPISIQLYSLREECQKDFPGVISRLGDIGYAGVEPFSLLDYDPKDIKTMLDGAGLVANSAHNNIIREADADAVMDAHAAIGVKDIVVPVCPPNIFENLDGINAFADEMNEMNEKIRVNGLTLGYHNHWWEFEAEIDGKRGYEHLFDALEADIFAELDVYWAQTGGADPIATIQALGPQCRYLHVKDGPCDDPQADHVAVGAGVVDIAGIIGASETPEWHVVELDRCGTDMFTAVEESYKFLIAEGLSSGKGA